MTYFERIALYLSGIMDQKTQIQMENEMLTDGDMFEEFIRANEQTGTTAPPGFAASVMREVRRQEIPDVPAQVPFLSRKMCAVVCFCSAAAVIAIAATGFENQLSQFLTSNFGKLNEMLSLIKIL